MLFPFSWCGPVGLLGQSRISAMNEAFRNQSLAIDLTGILVIVALIVAAVLIAAAIQLWYRKSENAPVTTDPSQLFRDLCGAHGLHWSQRRALMKLARLRNLPDPNLVFIDPGLWPIGREAQRQLGAPLYRQLSQVRRHLFDPIHPEHRP